MPARLRPRHDRRHPPAHGDLDHRGRLVGTRHPDHRRPHPRRPTAARRLPVPRASPGSCCAGGSTPRGRPHPGRRVGARLRRPPVAHAATGPRAALVRARHRRGVRGPTTGWGVRTRPGALCSWTVDESGIALWADVRSGGLPVLPGEREVDVATVVTAAGPTPFAAHKALCAAMSPTRCPPSAPSSAATTGTTPTAATSVPTRCCGTRGRSWSTRTGIPCARTA